MTKTHSMNSNRKIREKELRSYIKKEQSMV